MYHSWNLRRLLRYLALDTALVLAAILLTHLGKHHFPAVDSAGGVSLPVLMYHSVAPVPEQQYCVTPETLESDLRYLQAHGYETVSPEELVAYTNGNGTLPEKPVMLTFDDGLYNNLSLVLPLLETYDMCAVVSVVGIFTDEYAPDAPHNDVYSYLTWEDLKQMHDSGRITLGSHTYDMHENGTRQGCAKTDWETEEEYHETLYADLSLMQTRFQEELQIQPAVFAYPYGFVCSESKPVLADLGFQITLTCLEKPNFITRNPACLYGINRYNRPGNTSTAEIMQKSAVRRKNRRSCIMRRRYHKRRWTLVCFFTVMLILPAAAVIPKKRRQILRLSLCKRDRHIPC